ncbi:hypothetical protein J2D77_06280 [Acetobacter sp. TBRC 12339]|uniref:Uncharacterized protein n=1 Tax=Acetobacter garciniae TaxID=2817435 RepID=A0A939HNL9_9PROT|nr:hypothetical protein [Acetobacter garciniae]
MGHGRGRSAHSGRDGHSANRHPVRQPAGPCPAPGVRRVAGRGSCNAGLDCRYCRQPFHDGR